MTCRTPSPPRAQEPDWGENISPSKQSRALSFLLILISYIFWKIDLRNRQLIKGAESALEYFESISALDDKDGEPHVAKIFHREEYVTAKRRAAGSIIPWKSHYSYSNSFNRIFLSFTVIGIIGLIVAAIKFV